MSAPRPLAYYWNHPRRTGFILFNLAVLAAFVTWGVITSKPEPGGLAGLPNLMLGYAGMTVLVVAWIGSWIAWAVMVILRHRNHRTS